MPRTGATRGEVGTQITPSVPSNASRCALIARRRAVAAVTCAGMIVAVNNDPYARVFAGADVGIVGDWHEVVPLLVERIAQEGREDVSA